jgi:two-component system, chemotaxis family, sensor kinase CheA
VLRVKEDDIFTLDDRQTVHVAGSNLSVARLEDVLELPRADLPLDGRFVMLVVLAAASRRVAFVVDRVLEEGEALARRLGPQLMRVRNISGATVLASGEVVPVLYGPDLVQTAASVLAVGPPLEAVAADHSVRSVLVVDDSITSRMLIKNVLEAAGYAVTTATDGAEALATLRGGTFDLLVSDVEMPRMDGFQLTASVRSEEAMRELPVVLVTALESREHRERGMEVGANAYIGKSSFDNTNLLSVIKRLL